MKRLLIIAAAVIVIVNAAVYAHIVYNRSGEPQLITLTERELELPYRYGRNKDENSGMQLSLEWRSSAFDDSSYFWGEYRVLPLSEEKLAELNFQAPPDCNGVNSHRYNYDESRKAWLALEYDGPAYAKWSQQAEQSINNKIRELGKVDTKNKKALLQGYEDDLKRISYYESRLVAIDVNLDKEEMQKRYGDQSKVLLVAANISNQSYCNRKDRQIRVRVSQLLPGDINVPLQHRRILDNLPADRSRDYEEPPRYQVDIAMGKLNEPWVLDVRRIESTPN